MNLTTCSKYNKIAIKIVTFAFTYENCYAYFAETTCISVFSLETVMQSYGKGRPEIITLVSIYNFYTPSNSRM